MWLLAKGLKGRVKRVCLKPPHCSVNFCSIVFRPCSLLAVGLEATLSWPKRFFSTGIRFLMLRSFLWPLCEAEKSEGAPSFLGISY